MTTSVGAANALKVLEGSLHVEVRDGRVHVMLRSLVDPKRYVAVNVPVETWREFCRRQLALSVGGQA